MTLIVVSGAPGTGKSTVAAALAAGFGWPLLSLDPVKEALADVLGAGDQDWSNRVGDAAAEVFCRCEPEEAVRRMLARHGAGRHPIHRDVMDASLVVTRVAELAARVTPLGICAALVTADTQRPGSPDTVVTEVAAALAR